MKCSVLCLLAFGLVTPASATSAGSPVEKIVELLKDLQTKISHDGKTEEQAYDKYACWCDKTSTRKAKAIEDAQDSLRALGQQILKLKGKIAVLTAEIAELAQKIEDNLAAQEEATNVRQNENAAFEAKTAELKDALAALEQAVKVLLVGTAPEKKEASLLQAHTGAGAALRGVLRAMPASAALSPEKALQISEFLQAGAGSNYAPQSATIQGILQDMYETFSNDVESETRLEARRNREFEQFIETKQKELAQMREDKAQKEEEKAKAEDLLAETTQEYDDTEAQMKADIEFFDATKEACEAKHAAWTTRDDLRKEELEGVAKAIAILTTDEAREMFGKSIKAGKETGTKKDFDSGIDISESFLQVASDGSMSAPAARAFASLKGYAAKTHSLRLAQLAVQVHEAKVGHFDKVIESINTMMKTLQDEGDADIAKRDQCKDEYQKVASTVGDLKWKIEVNDATIDKLEALIAKRTAEKEKTIEDIAEVNSQIAAMEAQRIEENNEFMQAKSDDSVAVNLLLDARKVFTRYYKKNEIKMGPLQGSVKGALLQAGPDFAVSEDQAPDFDFSGKGKRKNESKGIVQIMTMLIEDLNDEISNGMKNEAAAQLEFEKTLRAANKLKSELKQKVVNLDEAIAARNEEKDEENKKKTSNEADLTDEQEYKQSITPDCDWILGAFEKRAERRTAEMSGLREASAYLAGANGAGLIQESHDVDFSKIRFLGISK